MTKNHTAMPYCTAVISEGRQRHYQPACLRCGWHHDYRYPTSIAALKAARTLHGHIECLRP